MISSFVFLSEIDLKNLYKKGKKIILWGMGQNTIPIVNTLKDLEIDFDYWGTGKTPENRYFDGKEILTYEDMIHHKDDIVLIGSFAYVPIYKKLKELGVKEIYGLRDVFKYSLSKHLTDQKELDLVSFENKEDRSNNILLELYGNIGDVIIRIGIVKRFIEKYGPDNVFLLFASNENADIYRLITSNIIVLSDSIVADDKRRIEVLKLIWKKQFDTSYILCDLRIYAQRRILNCYNSNISRTVCMDGLPERDYLVDLDIDNLHKLLDAQDKAALTGWGKISGEDLSNIYVNNDSVTEYVSINLGASRVDRQYPVRQFQEVCKYLVNLGYEIALLGYGKHDEDVASVLLADDNLAKHILDYTSQLSVSQTAKVISKSKFFVGTDSGMWNLSYILGIPSVVIYGGGGYGNFYHKDGIIKYASTEVMDCYNCEWFCDKADENGVAKCIRDVTPKIIKQCIDELIVEMCEKERV